MNHFRRRLVGAAMAVAAGAGSIIAITPHAEASPTPIPVSHCSAFSGRTPAITLGSVGSAVKRAQCDLVHAGYSIGSSSIDGRFGTATRTATLKFQRAHHLADDDVIGPRTWAALNHYDAR